jgi:DNA mismatch repair protein MutS2
MQPAVLRTLEFDRIRQALAHEALTALGRERAAALEPLVDREEVQQRLDLTSQATAYARAGGSLAISAPEDLPRILGTLGIEQHPLDPLDLLGLARFVESVGNVAAGLVKAEGRFLSAIAARVASFETEIKAIRRAIHDSGDVNDDASPALRDLRDKLRKQRGKLRSMLDGLMRGSAKYLQDQIVTDRNGRYVLVLRAEHREAIPGIVHGSSASGASLYVEPLSTVELNNEIVALAEREREEVRRILLALTDAFRRRADEFESLVDVAADVDELFAKVQLGRKVDGIAPRLTADGAVAFRGARHPLLSPAVREILEDGGPEGPPYEDVSTVRRPDLQVRHVVVGTDLLVTPPVRALVISGPNTGGKTVALKATGLLALMAQAGLLIPVEAGSTCTPFQSVFADIGDEQSISASLSTFSAHIANIVAMDRALALPALVLLDEVGGGTDPAEGGSLGIAVIDHFRRRGATVVATTHDDALKSYASTTDGVATAAFGFNPETYAPTYKLIYGAPGRSLAFEIAERLGMPGSVITDARARRSSREAQLAEHLARVDKELAGLDAERRGLEEARDAVAAERQALLARESKLTEREAVLKRRMDDKLNERLREAREEVDKIVADLKGKAGTKLAVSTGEIGGLRAEARSALQSVAGRIEPAGPAERGPEPLGAPPDVGDVVFVAPFGADGIVRGVSGKQIDVEVRGKRMRVALKDLKATGHRPKAQGVPQNRKPPTAASDSIASAARDLVLIGSTIDEAVGRAEKFLDNALMADERRLRVVHGHGTGRLRDALRRYFREHPLVASVAPAADNEGGDAATIVELKD